MNAVSEDLVLELLLEKSKTVPSPCVCTLQFRIEKSDHGQSLRLQEKVIVPGVSFDMCVEKSCDPEQSAQKFRVFPIAKGC